MKNLRMRISSDCWEANAESREVVPFLWEFRAISRGNVRSATRRTRPRDLTGETRLPSSSPRAGGTEIQDRAAVTGGAFEEAAALAVQHHDFVVVVDGLRVPIGWEQRCQSRMGRPHIHALRDQAGALRHPVMMAVDRGERPCAGSRRTKPRRSSWDRSGMFRARRALPGRACRRGTRG